jgi:hypothetical protein
MSWLTDLLNSVGEGEMAAKQGIDWRQKLVKSMQDIEQQKQQMQDFTEMAPMRKAQAESLVEHRKAQAAGFLTAEERIQNDRDKEEAARQLVMLKDSLAKETDALAREKIQTEINVMNYRIKNGLYGSRGGQGGGFGRLVIGGGPAYRVQNDGTITKLDLPGKMSDTVKSSMIQLQTSLKGAEDLMKILNSNSPDLHTGVVVGRTSKLGATVAGTRGPGPFKASQLDMTFDRIATSSFMTRLYAMTGKQINQSEMRILESIMPNRSMDIEKARTNAIQFYNEIKGYMQRWERLLNQGMSEEDAAAYVQSLDTGVDYLLQNPGKELPMPQIGQPPQAPNPQAPNPQAGQMTPKTLKALQEILAGAKQ